jgi:hypothetical protein
MRSKWLITLGALLVALSLVWNFAIFPSMAKMPADYEQEYVFEGSVQVFNADLGALVTIPTTMSRTLKATSVTDEDILLMQQDIVFYTSDGQPLRATVPSLAALDSSEVYGLDRTTRANVSGNGDMDRTGQFTFPADVQQETYQYWSSSTRSAISATFMGEETYQGINVYVFEMDSTGNPYPNAANGLPQTLGVYAKIRVEPVSGVPVYATTITTILMDHPLAGPMPVLINTSTFTSATVDEMIDLANETSSKILWFGVYGFWGVLGLGVVLTAGGVLRSTRGS